ncbi:unnamed protein product [Rotaria magnacalcarata]|uniref:Zinc transporter 1 n=1 Tax=Rotaria magnacalcarata TaxID=392030 RepID=A0A814NBU5_9BILA|nr:unnamed protein product [Rotaria magnacalcarata]CAF3804323.1 unnamed protein product [Rotaria magnacalcarata]
MMESEDTSSIKQHHHQHEQHHHHEPKRRIFQTKTFRLLSMLSLTFMYFIVELVVGEITNSVALVADAFHMLSDVISLVIAIVAVRIAKRRSDINTYGWVRAEVVGANINTVFLLALCLTIVFDAIKRFIQPEPIENVNLLLIVGSIGLGINIIGLFLFQGFHGHSHGGSSHGHSHGSSSHGHSHENDSSKNGEIELNLNENALSDLEEISNKFERHSTRALQEAIAECANQTDEQSETVIDMDDNNNNNKTDTDIKTGKPQKKRSMNMHGVFLHVLADALGSIVVIISALLIKFVPHDPENRKHWTIYIDPTLSVIIIIIITISTIPLFKETSYILLQAIPRNLEINGIKTRLLENIPEIHSVHELHVWRLTDDKVIASAHLNRKSLSNYMTVAEKVKKFFHSIGIHSVTIQYECDDDLKTERQPLTTITNEANSNSTDKIPGDCLLRCENDECETQACCTKSSDRNNILLNNKMEVLSVTQTNNYENCSQLQTSVNPSFQE